MKIKCAIIDDEQFAIDSLVRYCREITYIEIVATFIDPYKALSYLEYNTPDLIFLDIHMPEISGIQIAKSIKGKTMFVFTTAYTQYALNGFNLNAVDYLLKPFGFERFRQAIEKVKIRCKTKDTYYSLNVESKYLIVKVEYQNVCIELSEILYIEALDNYSRIFTTKRIVTTLMNLKRIITYLPDNEFIRIHKSFIVSKSKLEEFSKGHIVIEGKTIPIGRHFAGNIKFLYKDS
jgi:two-component system, LytTR family, response regulator LytT